MVTFGIIGCGRIGQMHAQILMREDRANLAAVYDVNEQLASEISMQTSATFCNSDEEIFNNSNLDAVLISSATATHADYIEKAVKSGKAVFCEKPIDLSLDRIRSCYANISSAKLPIQVGFNRRFDPGHSAVKKALDEGKIGDLHQVIITSRDPEMPTEQYYKTAGGLFRDMTIHDFDLARFYLGEDPIEIYASAQRMIDPALMNKIGDYDTAMFILCGSDGKQCLINNSRTAVYGYDQRVELLGSKGMLQSDNVKTNQMKYFMGSGTEISSPYLHFFIERYQDAFSAQLRSFINAVELGQPPAVGFEDGYKALVIAEAAYLAIKKGAKVPINYNW
jgi:myo-inositol 2-dehydrogenase/D-chiro-inositol 1-dehydrogenase